MLLVPATPPAPPAPRRSGLLATSPRLSPYLSPHGRPARPRRVSLASGLRLAAQPATILTRLAFKWATDALVAVTGNTNTAENAATADWLWRAPILLTVLYGLSRIAMALLTQVRDGLFAKVAMHAVRQLAL